LNFGDVAFSDFKFGAPNEGGVSEDP